MGLLEATPILILLISFAAKIVAKVQHVPVLIFSRR